MNFPSDNLECLRAPHLPQSADVGTTNLNSVTPSLPSVSSGANLVAAVVLIRVIRVNPRPVSYPCYPCYPCHPRHPWPVSTPPIRPPLPNPYIPQQIQSPPKCHSTTPPRVILKLRQKNDA